MKYNELKFNTFFYIYVLLIVIIYAFLSNNIDPDFWARIMQGDAFWQLGHILKTDIFSYTPTHIWIDHEWGASVIFSFILNYFGYWGIFCFKILISLLIIVFIFKTIRLKHKETFCWYDILIAAAGISAMPTVFQSSLRCHFFTFLFFTIYIYILERVRNKFENKLLLILPLIMIIWVNCHGGCVAGLGMLAIYTFGEFLNKKPFKKYLFTLLACLAVMFINPYGIDYVKFVFIASTMPRTYVTEWISPFVTSSGIFNLFKIFYILFFILLFLRIKDFKNDFTKYILLIVCAYLSYKYIKNIPFFIIVSMIFLYENLYFHQKKDYKIFPYLIIAFCILGIGSYDIVKNADFNYLSEQPVHEIEFLKINDLKGKILAPLDLGSYTAYKLFPNNLIYMDGRYEEVYFYKEKELLDKFYNAQDGWQQIFEEPYKPDYIIIPADALINDYIPENYKTVYNTEFYIIYSLSDKLKDLYYVPSDDEKYYIKNAFKKGFEFQKTDKKSL